MRIAGQEWEDLDPKPAVKVRKWYDRHVKSWSVWSEDEDGNQVGESTYVYSKTEAEAEVKEREEDVRAKVSDQRTAGSRP